MAEKNEFGFTSDPADIERVRAFRAAAIADGWTNEPTYINHESVSRASIHMKDGYKMMVLARENNPGGKWGFEAQISIWGPDGLAIHPPEEYDFNAISAGQRHCNYCGADNVETVRISFAGRCCKPCRPELAKTMERPGWTR